MFYYSRKDSYTVHRCHDIVQSLFITTIRIQFVNLFFFFCFHSCLHSPNPTSSLIFFAGMLLDWLCKGYYYTTAEGLFGLLHFPSHIRSVVEVLE